MAPDTMLYWLAKAAKDAREAADRKQVHVGAAINRDQSAIYRFEQATAWPRDPDLLIAGYAEDLDISPIDLWDTALKMWREHGVVATVEEINHRRTNTALAADAVSAAEDAAEATRGARSSPARKRPAKGSP